MLKLEKDIKLLDKSIKHWMNVIVGEEEADDKSCALCQEYASRFRTKRGDHCEGCPIAIETGKDSCEGTPFQNANEEAADKKTSTLFRVAMLNFIITLKNKLVDEVPEKEPISQAEEKEIAKLERDIKLLEESMIHWRRVIRSNENDPPTDEGCALCGVYNKQESPEHCIDELTGGKCPIFEFSGVDGCENTPFDEAADEYDDAMCQDDHESHTTKKRREEFRYLRSVKFECTERLAELEKGQIAKPKKPKNTDKEIEKLKMDIELLNQSIDHWIDVTNCVKDVTPNEDNCPLCNTYNINSTSENMCVNEKFGKCPIYEFSGYSACQETPYPDASEEYRSAMNIKYPKEYPTVKREAELQYLKTIRWGYKCKLAELTEVPVEDLTKKISKEKPTYHMGQILKIKKPHNLKFRYYLIARGHGYKHATLVNVKKGTPKNTRHEVKDVQAITEAELDNMIGHNTQLQDVEVLDIDIKELIDQALMENE